MLSVLGAHASLARAPDCHDLTRLAVQYELVGELSSKFGTMRIPGTGIAVGVLQFTIYEAGSPDIPPNFRALIANKRLLFIESYIGVPARPGYGTKLLKFAADEFPDAALVGTMANVNRARLSARLIEWLDAGRPEYFDWSSVPFLRLNRPFQIHVSQINGSFDWTLTVLYPNLSDHSGARFLNAGSIPSSPEFRAWLEMKSAGSKFDSKDLQKSK